jgi:hypothetical protein
MSKRITLSPKHGVNPSMDLCFWCGQPKGLILCGRMHEKKGDRTDVEAPKGMVMNLEPCDKCKENFNLGVQIVEVVDDGSKFHNDLTFAIQAEDKKVKWPTGRFVVMKAESIKGGKPGMRMLCTTETMDRIFEAQDARERAKDAGDSGKEKKE